MRPRIVRNLLDFSFFPLGAPGTLVNATTTALSDGWRKIESTASSFRAIYQITLNGCEAGKRYAYRAGFRNITASVVGKMAYKFGGTGTFTTVGTWLENAGAANSVLGGVFDCTVSGTLILRFGVGLESGAGVHPWSMEIGDFLIAEIPASQSVPPEYVFPARSLVTNKTLAVQNVGGFVVDGVGVDVAADATDAILVLGDSFGNDSNEWPQVSEVALAGQKAIYQNAVSGRAILQAISDAPNQLNLSALNLSGTKTYPAFPVYAQRPGMCVVALGVNDINGNATLAQMQERFESMTALCFSSGVTKLLWFDIPPWKNNASWSAPKELVRGDYNAWLITRISSDPRMRLFKISDVLKDGTDPAVLLAAYDSGDHLHPNATGMAAISAAVEPYLLWGWGKWTLFDASMPPLSLSPDCPGKLKQVQEWSKVASAKEIERY